MSEAFDPYYTWLGIHPQDQPPDHYRLLGLRTFEENPDVISNAADRQMMMVRTFQSGPRAKQSQQILNQISTAKVCLLTPQQKSDYDQRLAATAGVSRDSSTVTPAAPKPAAPRKIAKSADAMPTPTPHIVVASDARSTIARSTMSQPLTQRPAWQRPAVVGSAAAAVLALIIISAIMLAVSSSKAGPDPPDNASANLPAGLANAGPENLVKSDTPVADAGRSTNPVGNGLSTTPSNVRSASSDTRGVAAPPAGQWLKAQNRQTGKVIGVWTGATTDGTSLVQWEYVSNAPNQHWQLERVEDGAYRLLNRRSKKYATAVSGDAGAPIHQHGLHPDLLQTWRLEPKGNDSWVIATPDNSLVIAVDHDATANGAMLVLTPLGTSSSQQWSFDMLPPAEAQIDDPNDPTAPSNAAPAESTVTGVEPSSKPVDLLALIKVDRDVQRGQFIRQGKNLICAAGSVHIPYPLPDQYVLTAEVARIQDNNALQVGLVIGGRPCMHLIDGYITNGTLCGLELVDNQRLPENPSRRVGQLLTEDKPATIVYTVRQNRLTVTIDGQTVTQWDGAPNRLGWFPFFKEPKDRNLYIGSWGSVYRFSKLELVPLGGGAAATPVAGATPGESVEPVERLAVPDVEKQKVVLGQVQEIYKDEYQAATDADGRMALVEKLIEQSGEAGLDAAAKFVLLSEAYKYAAEAVQPEQAFQAADQLGRQFDVDPLDLKITAVSGMDKAAWDADSRKRVATAAMAVSRACLLDDRAPTAEKLSELAEDAATRSRDGELRIETRTWHADVRQFVKQWTAADAAKKVLATKPDDAEANTQLGKFLCLTMDDWKKGLPHLVKTDRANVRQLAEMELAAPPAATDRVELADAWWDAAKSAVSDEKDAYQRRARHWYQAALPELAGLQKIKVEKRLETLADVGQPFLVARGEVAPQAVALLPEQPQPARPEVRAPPASIALEKRQELSWEDRYHVTIDVSPDGRKVAVKLDGLLVCWDIATGKVIRTIDLPHNGFHGPAFSADSSQLGCPISKGTFAFFDLRTGALTRKFDQGPVVAFSKNGRIMATVSRTEPTIEVLDTQNGRMQQLKGYAKTPDKLTLSTDGRMLLSGGRELPTFVWDVATTKQLPVGNNASALAFSPDGELYAVAASDNSLIKLGKTATGMTVRELIGHERSPSTLNFSPDGQLLAACEFRGQDSAIKIWNGLTGKCLATVDSADPVRWVAFAADNILVTGGNSKKVILWDIKPR